MAIISSTLAAEVSNMLVKLPIRDKLCSNRLFPHFCLTRLLKLGDSR